MREQLSTGIEGLDHILCGGLPRGRVYLVQGDPGVGKTTLGLQFLLEGVRRGEKVLYLTLSETREELLAVAASHGWNMDGVDIHEHVVSEGARGSDTSVFYASEVELGETIAELLRVVEEKRPDRVVIDALSEIRLLAQSSLRYRRQVLGLKQFFAGRDATALLLDDRTGDRDMQLQSVPHGVIELERFTPIYGAARRRLEIVKLRALAFRDGYHDFTIRTGGIVVFPRLVAAEHAQMGDRRSIASGITSLDEMLGGGIDRGTSTLIMGPAGCGKSALATQYAVAAARRGEHAVMLTFEESNESLFTRSTSLGLELPELVDKGLVTICHIDPAQLQPGEFAEMVRGYVERESASVVVIDSINGYLNAVPEERFLMLHLHELLTYLGSQRVATILVFAQHGLIGSMSASVDLSYLADCVLLLRFYEARGKLHKAISVVKRRSGTHDPAIRGFSMNANGLQVGNALEKFRGVLSGVPFYEGTGIINGDTDE